MSRARLAGGLCAITSLLAVDGMTTQANAQATFELYGFAMVDAIYDTKRVNPAWEDAFRPSRIATENNEFAFGSDGQASVSVKQSRFGVQGNVPVYERPLTFKFEFDFFGVGVDEGQTTIRLRHMYGEWGQILAGQTHSLLMDIDVFPNTIDYWGPSGMVFYRLPQLRWTPYRTATSHFAIALERPGNDIDPGQIREFDPALGSNLHNDEKLADLTSHFYTSGTWGHFQIAGIVRRIGFDTFGTIDNEPKGHKTGWGINVSGHANLFKRDKLLGQVVYGEGIATYMNDGGTDLAPEGIGPLPVPPIAGPAFSTVRAKAVPLLGVLAYYDHYWNDAWSSSIGYSFTRVDNTNMQSADAFHKGQYFSLNLLYSPDSKIMMGGEVLWGQRDDHNGATGDDWRFQFSVKYNFGAKLAL